MLLPYQINGFGFEKERYLSVKLRKHIFRAKYWTGHKYEECWQIEILFISRKSFKHFLKRDVEFQWLALLPHLRTCMHHFPKWKIHLFFLWISATIYSSSSNVCYNICGPECRVFPCVPCMLRMYILVLWYVHWNVIKCVVDLSIFQS